MDAKMAAAATNMNNNFDPISDFIKEEDCDTLILYLPGFSKEQLRVQLAKSGILKISGTRPVGNNKWSSFLKDFRISENCDTSKISAKFEESILYVKQPKVVVVQEKEEIKLPEPAQIQKTSKQDKIQNTKADDDDKVKQTTVDEKSSQGKEETKSKEEISSGLKKDNKNEARADDQKGALRSSSEKQDNISGMQKTVAKLDDVLVNPATRLKKARQLMNIILAVLVAFALGMYVSSNLGWRSEKLKHFMK